MTHVALVELVKPAAARSRHDGSLPVYSVTKHQGFVPSREYFKKQVFSRDTSGYKMVESGQFAYATIHLDEGSIGIAPERCLISPMYTAFEVDDRRVDARFLLHYLKSPRALSQYTRFGKGTVHRRKAISLEALGQLTVPLPPLDEQRRIAAVLDQVDDLLSKRRLASSSLRELSESMLAETLRSVDQGVWQPFAAVCQRVTVGVVVRPASYYVPRGVPALRTLNVKSGQLDLDDLVYFSPAANDGALAKSKLKAGDLVIARTGQPGATATIPPELDGCNAIDLIIATPNQEHVLPPYLEALMNSPVGRRGRCRRTAWADSATPQRRLPQGRASTNPGNVGSTRPGRAVAAVARTAQAVESARSPAGSSNPKPAVSSLHWR